MNARLTLLLAAGLLFLAVAAGAFGAHGLRNRIAPELLVVYQTAVQYQAWHALGLLGVGVLLSVRPDFPGARSAAWLFVVGIVLFSGSLYVLALTGVRSFGAVTPMGGVAFLIGWATLAWGAWRS